MQQFYLFRFVGVSSRPEGSEYRCHDHMHMAAFRGMLLLIGSAEPRDEPDHRTQIALDRCRPLDDKQRNCH